MIRMARVTAWRICVAGSFRLPQVYGKSLEPVLICRLCRLCRLLAGIAGMLLPCCGAGVVTDPVWLKVCECGNQRSLGKSGSVRNLARLLPAAASAASAGGVRGQYSPLPAAFRYVPTRRLRRQSGGSSMPSAS